MKFNTVFLVVLLAILFILQATVSGHFITLDPVTSRHYSPAMLKALMPTTRTAHPNNIPPELRRRKRGRRGGVRVKVRRRYTRPALPVIVTGNAQSLNNKLDELSACCRHLYEYREASILCFSETWFKQDTPTSSVEIDGFSVVRSDRSVESTGKSRGGGVCAYINERWCDSNNIHLKTSHCTADIEFLTVVLRPYYLPREFNKICLNIIYIPPDANATVATSILSETLSQQQTSSPDSIIIATGDFNHVKIDRDFPSFHQYVSCPTREDKTLDLCYVNVPLAYKCNALPPLGDSDHNMVHLMPAYKTKLKSSKPEKKNVTVWDESAYERLRGCFECTDWSVFTESCESLEELNDHVCSYIKFCESLVTERKEVICYSNNKPWVTKDLKQLLNDKRQAFREGNTEKLKCIRKKVQTKITECRKEYKEKIEERFKSNNSKDVWNGLKSIVGFTPKQPNVHVSDGNSYVDELNQFYARFDCFDFIDNIQCLKCDISCNNDDPVICTNEDEIKKVFSSLKRGKASGPDAISTSTLKMCAEQLANIFSVIFNKSLSLHEIPVIWKTSKVVPVPKKGKVKSMNDLRPVALTSVLMKCLEKVILRSLLPTYNALQDSLQFAYRANRSVEDAILLFTDNLYKHLDKPKNYARVLFIDFSSAFNTIQPHILVPKLLEMNINKHLILWVIEFLTNRPQYVVLKANNVLYESGNITTNTGAPQGSVLSPVLFTIYTNDCRSQHQNVPIIKYADDTTIQALITSEEDLVKYKEVISNFTTWCDDHYLQLNVQKTKEMIVDFRTKNNTHSELNIKEGQVEKVSHYKYLGVTFNEKLEWHSHASSVISKVSQRMYFVRKLNQFNIDKTIIHLFYRATIISVISFCISAWGGNTRSLERAKIDSILRKVSKITSTCPDYFKLLYETFCIKKLLHIREDTSHPLHNDIKISERSGRLIHIKANRERYKNSFKPSAIRICDKNYNV